VSARPLIAVLLVGLAQSRVAAAWGQAPPIAISLPTGEVGADFEGWRAAYPLSPRRSLLTFREWVELRLAGALADPGLLSFRLALRPMQTQLDWSGPAELAAGRGDRIDFSAGVHALAGGPVSLSGAMRRSSGTTPAALGSTVDYGQTERSGRLDWRNRYFPIALSVEDRSFVEIFRLATQPEAVRLDARARTLRLEAENRKTTLLLERYGYDDRAGGLEFTSARASLNHRARWGKRSSLRSALLYNRRTGASSYERVSWDEGAHLQHTWRVWSDYRFGLLRIETPLGTSRGRVGDVAITAQLHPLLALGVGGRAQSIDYTAGRQRYYRLAPEARHTTALPYRGRLTAGASVAFERVRQEPGPDGRLAVVNEGHVIDATTRFQLDNPNADRASVVVANAGETLIYQESLDYRLSEFGPFLEVVVLPGGRIAVGDTVLVDYLFSVLPTARVGALTAAYDASVQMGGVELYHRRVRRNQRGATPEVATGSPGTIGAVVNLGDRDERTTGVRLRRETWVGTVDIGGERMQLRSGGFAFTSTRIQGGLSVPARRDLRGALRATWSATEDGGIRSELGSVGSSAEWTPAPALRVRAELGAWWWRERGTQRGLRQRFLGGDVEAAWRIRLVNVEARYERGVWKETFANMQNRVSLRLTRTF
jgi:hypothetical protein